MLSMKTIVIIVGRKKTDKRKVGNEVKTDRLLEEPKKQKIVKYDTEPKQVQSESMKYF